MKRILWLIPLAVILFTGSIVMETNNKKESRGNTQVEKLWKDYEAAQKADRPQRQQEILLEIKKVASKERLPWDFYRAGQDYVDVSSSRNWKLRDSLYSRFQKEIEEFDEPVLTFYNSRYDLNGKADFLDRNRSRLEKGHNTEFYENDESFASEIYEEVLVERIPNDWEYALWSLVLINRWNPRMTEGFETMLEETLGDRYPDAAFLDYTRITRMEDEFRRKERLEEYARKYDGRAVALMARRALLEMEFESLVDKGTSDRYRALRDKAAAFEKDRKGFSGSERKIAECCSAEELLETLDSKDISFTVEDGVLKALLRNLDAVNVSVKDKEKNIFTTRLDNPVKSYYVEDTLSLRLPAFDDGTYTIEGSNGKVSTKQDYSRYGLSASHKQDAQGYAVYVARAKSGEPVRKADITLLDNKEKVIAEVKDFILKEGFTYLPKDLIGKFSDNRYRNYLVFSFRDSDGSLRKTPQCSLAGQTVTDRGPDDQTYASVFVDRSAFNPGETVQFKVLVYHGDRAKKLEVSPGKELTVKLEDPQGRQVTSLDFTTNEYGSAAGSFLLERAERNGMFRIRVECDGRYLCSTQVRVDDFVLPTFDLSFDPDPNLYFPGDDIEVKGTLKSYSGHSLASADIRYSVTQGASVVSEGVLHPDSDGRFTISFKSGQDRYLYYNVHVGVSDATGETLEWNTGRQVQRNIPFSATLENQSQAQVEMMEEHVWRENENYSHGVVAEDVIKISLHTGMYRPGVDQNRPTLRIDYTLKKGDRVLASGKAAPGDLLELDTSGYPSGLYVFEAVATDKDVYGNEVKSSTVYDILKVKDGDTVLDASVRSLFKASDKGGGITAMLGSTAGPVWAVVELYGTDNVLLGSRMIHLEGRKGVKGSLETVRFDWPAAAPDVVRVNVVYFKDYRQYSFSRQFERTSQKSELPLAFTRFLDKTAPGTAYSFEIGTKPGVECAATIFDIASERIMSNRWNRILIRSSEGPTVNYRNTTGSDRTERPILYRGGGRIMMKSAARTNGAVYDMVEMAVEAPAPMPMAVEEEALEETAVLGYAANSAAKLDDSYDMGEDITVREDFAKTVAFEPFLRSDSNGTITLDFTTADKLSTFIVQLFAHNKGMDNAVLRQETVVTVPAKVSVVEPQFLYAGDRYFVKASLSSGVDETLSGKLRIDLYNGKDYRNGSPIGSTVKAVTLKPREALSQDLGIDVPDIEELGIKLTFIADGEGYGSDAVFVSVPVFKAVQTLTEAHSSILHSGESMESLIAQLKSEFVNISGEDAEMRVISLLDMVKEALPTKAEPASDNALDLSEALYVRQLAAKLGSTVSSSASDANVLAKLLACRNSDGGFGWFKDMDSSPIITAVLLDRYASLVYRNIDVSAIPDDTVEAAVKYLDKMYFGDGKRPLWCGGLSEEQYVSVRVRYPEVEFSTKDIDSKQLREFRKRMKEYLTPRKERGLNGYVFGKARRLRALVSLAGSDDGRRLASAWGIRFGTGAKLRNSIIKDLISLQEYAVGHKSGGWYYPNAVMPFRGLMESEAYAHAYIADLLRDRERFMDKRTDAAEALSIADGISLWLMVQKETQHWDEDAAFVDAISTVLDASPEILDTRIVTLSKTFTKPFTEVEAFGNGFKVERRFFVERSVEGKVARKEISDGEMLRIGDKVFAEYRIWNEENRSFVRLTAPRPANLRPANQLSGQYGWWLRPLSVAGWHSFTPHGYRSVLSERTEYWFDSYPEENTTVTEEFLVTQAGAFQTPTVSIESLYAPHYRAADRGRGPLLSE